MAPSLVTIDASEPLDKIFEVIDRDGGVIISNFLSPELLQESMAAIEPHFSARKLYTSTSTHKELGADFFPEGSQRGLLGKMPDQIVKIMRLPVWQGIMAHYLNDEFSSYTGDKLVPQKSGYVLGSTAALRLVPGAKPQPLHRATAVIPGSHLWGSDRAPKLEECTYAEMEPGSALFTLGSTYHGAGENKCDRSDPDAMRTLFACFAQRDYFRLDQNEVLSTPIEIARTLPDDILKLAGYYKAVSGVGYVEDHQSPVEFMQRHDNGIGKYGPTSKNLNV
ncbi:Phytanoyl-coa dioxygenase [Fusarium acuminatum]|uniref:Phytanoyl-coa dioxygenase n=1 Tax=Fusarium acuminatum TaxID=5515 RepID=A0ABZ2X0K8_9HYPO